MIWHIAARIVKVLKLQLIHFYVIFFIVFFIIIIIYFVKIFVMHFLLFFVLSYHIINVVFYYFLCQFYKWWCFIKFNFFRMHLFLFPGNVPHYYINTINVHLKGQLLDKQTWVYECAKRLTGRTLSVDFEYSLHHHVGQIRRAYGL